MSEVKSGFENISRNARLIIGVSITLHIMSKITQKIVSLIMSSVVKLYIFTFKQSDSRAGSSVNHYPP